MNRSNSHLDVYNSRHLSLHKPGTIPKSSRNISPIIRSRHKYELKQKIWPKETVESWFQKHSRDDRRAVYSFLNTLYDVDNNQIEDQSSIGRHRKTPSPRSPGRVNTAVMNTSNYSSQRRLSNNGGHESRASKRDLGEILESLESFRKSPSFQEKGIQTSATPITVPLPDVNETKNSRKAEKHLKRSTTSLDKYTETVQPQNSTDNNANVNVNDNENNKIGRRYLSQTWRVINPREDMELNVRPENNASSFFHYTKKVYPEYFFIHPDWY
ncbi:unnamed protein product [Rotaria sp. Silwood1]|nr:unnamed protein product [Rotaria sp. Silwood1]CAF3322693.1 unnamed protein product [Rotaria sp. Silwood1]CAF3346901.1 unnamed protein product [Rotaria sp. Silwood1]CAF4544711.1 unnamed protein product [Rotaria sp. Silwood1]CAF4589102.1 unnamed protein product [Rotaria sp. Silwood1]